MLRRLVDSIAALPQPLREVLLLADVVGCEPRAAAASLGLELVEFDARRQVARCRLAALLEDVDGSE
jgi:DNA-directed RNA polymerase specialized sigma24 family protein